MKRFAGVDVGGTNTRITVFDETGNAVGQARARTRDVSDPLEFAAIVATLLHDALALANIEPTALESIGVGLAGQLSSDGELVINAPNLGWRNVMFAQTLRDHLRPEFGSLEVLLVNDLSAILWGEHLGGAARGCDDVLAVYVGTGIGGAILAGGQLLSGAGGKSGEIGHAKVVVGGRLCGCGERGCVEAYAGGVHLEAQVAEIAHRLDLDQVFADLAKERVDLLAADRLSTEVPALQELWERATDYLAIVLANACTLLNPGVLLLGGGVIENCPNFKQLTLEKTPPLVLAAARDDLEIRFPTLGDEAGMLGAARLAIK